MELPDGKTTHSNTDTGKEPDNPGVYAHEKVQSGAQAQRSEHRLYELAKEYYLFILSPMYVIARADFDILAQYGQDVKLDTLAGLIHVRCAGPVIGNPEMGTWGNVVHGVPKQYAQSIKTYVTQLAFVDRTSKPFKYWRADVVESKMLTPGEVNLTEAPVDIYLPTGVDHAVGLYRDQSCTHWLTKLKPETWVVEEAHRYFTSALPNYFNDMSLSR